MGQLRFGALPAEVKVCLGVPDYIDGQEVHNKSGLGWYYDRLRLDVFFHTGELATETWKPDDPLRLILLTTSSNYCTLWENRIIGRPKKSIMRLLSSRGYQKCRRLEQISDSKDLDDYEMFRVDELSMDLHFVSESLRTVQWGVPMREAPFSYCFPKE